MNEIEATAKKAATGAGYPWGLAEEAAKAVRWLCAHDMDGCRSLADLLGRVDGTPLSDWMPRIEDEAWAAAGGPLCPLATGAAMSDRAFEMAAGVRFGAVAQPILLVPFAALAARQLERTVSVAWEGAEAITDGHAVCFAGTLGDTSAWASVRVGGQVEAPNESAFRADPRSEDWSVLNRFAHRTYAPATEESRLKGAGAGVSDND